MKYLPAYAWNGLFVGQPSGLSWQRHLILWLISFNVGVDPRVCPKRAETGLCPYKNGWFAIFSRQNYASFQGISKKLYIHTKRQRTNFTKGDAARWRKTIWNCFYRHPITCWNYFKITVVTINSPAFLGSTLLIYKKLFLERMSRVEKSIIFEVLPKLILMQQLSVFLLDALGVDCLFCR